MQNRNEIYLKCKWNTCNKAKKIEYLLKGEEHMKYIVNCIKGIAIGVGAIIPGVSSGVICVILGVYEDLLDSVLNIFKNFKENIKYLLPITVGVLIGMVLFGKILNYLFYEYPIQTNFTFIGLVLGSIPSLLKQVKKKEKFKFYYIFYLLIAVTIGLVMVIMERYIVTSASDKFSFFYLFFAGMCMSAGVVVPGVSSTVILMILGVYSAYITSVARVYLPVLVPIGIGLFIGSLIWMKLVKLLLDRFYVQTFYSIIGFTIGSVFVLYPGITFDLNGVTSILCFLLGWIVAAHFWEKQLTKPTMYVTINNCNPLNQGK